MSLLVRKYNDLQGPTKFYDGTEELWFSPSKWLWVRKEGDKLEPLSGVTGVCKIVDKSASLMPWAVKKAMERLRILVIAQHLGPNCAIELFEKELDEIIAQAKKADREELESAGATGHDAHAWIEQLIKAILAENRSRELEILAKLPEDERAAQCCVGAVEWMAKHNVRWLCTEKPVYSRIFRYAGTMDGLAYCDSCNDLLCCPHPFSNRLSIIDWKTSNYLYTTYLMQVDGAYRHAYIEEFGAKIEDVWVNRLDKETGDFDPWHIEGEEPYQQDFEAFRHALDLTRSLKTIEDRINVIRETRREARKKARDAERDAAHRIACPKSKDYRGARLTKCLPDGTQCAACRAKYLANQEKSS